MEKETEKTGMLEMLPVGKVSPGRLELAQSEKGNEAVEGRSILVDVFIGLARQWENLARLKWLDGGREEDPMGKRLIEHGALCYQNCASELREVLTSSSPRLLTIQGEG
jgi:hypothetical protein